MNTLWANTVGKPASPDDMEIEWFEENGIVYGWKFRVKNRVWFGDLTAFIEANKEEFMVEADGYLRNNKHSYHYQSRDPSVYAFRIDKNESQGLHANPDDKLWQGRAPKLKRHLYPPDLKLDITDFCLLYFLYTALFYRRGLKYPLFPDIEDDYNHAIAVTRKQVQIK